MTPHATIHRQLAFPNHSLQDRFRPAPWLCFRTWRAQDDEWLTMLSDERRHQIATLDGASSQLWSAIEEQATYQSLLAKAKDLQVGDQLPDFLAMLHERGFIVREGEPGELTVQPDTAPAPQLLELADNTRVEHDVMRWVAQKGFLFGVHWEVTYRCNERCIHCYNPGAAHLPHEKPERETNELTPAEALTLLDDLRAAGVFRLTLSGGEVMLRRDFWDLVGAARERGFSVNVYTNGLKLDEAACDRLAALWPTTVSVSVYSADPAAHDAITCVPGSYSRSLNALERLNARGIKTFLKSTQMAHTLGGYAQVNALAAKVGAGPEIDMMMSAAVDGAAAPLALAARAPEELVVLAATPGSPLSVGDASTDWGRSPKDPNYSVCGAGVGSLGIDPEGGIKVCNSMPLPAGSHREHGFLSVWRASRQYRRAHTDTHSPASVEAAVAPLSHWQGIVLKDFHECGTHRRCAWCTKCPGLAMLEHGDPLAPSTTNCRLATARMTAADLLSQGLTREDIATRLGVASEFGRLPARVIPIVQEHQRGTGFSPVDTAMQTLTGHREPLPLTRHSLQDLQGQPLLRQGTKETVEAIASFERVISRFPQNNLDHTVN